MILGKSTKQKLYCPSYWVEFGYFDIILDDSQVMIDYVEDTRIELGNKDSNWSIRELQLGQGRSLRYEECHRKTKVANIDSFNISHIIKCK